MEPIEERIASLIPRIKQLKQATKLQRNLVRLYELPTRSKTQERELSVLYRLEEIEQRAERDRLRAREEFAKVREREISEGDKRLLRLGHLVAHTGLHHLEEEVLLGALLHLSGQLLGAGGGELQSQLRPRGQIELKQLPSEASPRRKTPSTSYRSRSRRSADSPAK